MRAKISNVELKKTVGYINSILPSVEILPVYSNIKIEVKNNKLYINGGNGEIFAQKVLNVEEGEDGTVIVNGKKFIEVIRNLPGEYVYIIKENEKLRITSERVKYELIYASDEDYIADFTPPELNSIKIETKKIKNIFSPLIFAAAKSTSSVSAALRGILFEIENNNITGVATDGHKLALCKSNFESSFNYQGIVPSLFFKAFDFIEDEEVEIKMDESKLFLKDSHSMIITRLIEGNYPDYRNVIPQDYPFKLTFDKSEMLSGIKIVGVFSDKITNGITMNLKKDRVELLASSPESGEARYDFFVDYKGDDFNVSFNKNYMQDILRNTYGNKVVIEFIDGESALLIRPEEESDFKQLFLLMPIVY